jgi:superfamily I DNA/RNA helicase
VADSSWWLDINELDDEQSDVIGLPPEGDYLVVGPPGSGKTNLILLRASYLVDSQRPNVVVLMFTRSLREFVVRGSANYAVAEDKIQTIMKWEQGILREQGVVIARDPNFKALRLAHAQRLAAVFDAKPALEKHLDCILVDEVQDCLPEEVDLFFRAAKHVFFVGDDRQQIYEKNGNMELLANRLTKKELTKHYRNGEAICKVADVIGRNFGERPLLGSCNYDETKAKSSATFEACTNEADVISKLVSRLTQQLKAYPGELLGVACPTNQATSKVREALEKSSQLKLHLLDETVFSDPFDDGPRISISTMHDAKGLEFRAMHLPFAEQLKKLGETQKRLAFTSVTRAKTSLSVYHVEPLPGYFEQAREHISPLKPPPEISSLFRGKKK